MKLIDLMSVLILEIIFQADPRSKNNVPCNRFPSYRGGCRCPPPGRDPLWAVVKSVGYTRPGSDSPRVHRPRGDNNLINYTRKEGRGKKGEMYERRFLLLFRSPQ